MKKLLGSLLALMLVVCSCTAFAAERKMDAVITLYSNPSTGYSWSYTTNNDGMISEISHSYSSSNPELLGSDGGEEWHFQGLKEGNVSITFTYSRHWDGSDAKTKTFTYYIDSDLNMHLLCTK